MILDDWFPSINGKAAFCSSLEGEIWAMLLEKAWAKLHGSYFRADGGFTSHAAQHLLGHPTFSIEHSETDLLETHFLQKC